MWLIFIYFITDSVDVSARPGRNETLFLAILNFSQVNKLNLSSGAALSHTIFASAPQFDTNLHLFWSRWFVTLGFSG